MKTINEYLTSVNESISSPVDSAKRYLYGVAANFDFDYEKTKAEIDARFDNDKIIDYLDRFGYTNAQASKFIDTLRKLYDDKSAFDKTINKINSEKKSAEDALNAKKMKKTDAVKEFLKEIMDNGIKIIIDKYGDTKTYTVNVNDDGDIVLK